MQILLGGTTIFSMGIAIDNDLAFFQILMFNDGGTSAQDWNSFSIARGSSPGVELSRNSSTEDTTGALDIVIQGALNDAADTIALETSLIEYLGRS